MTTVAQRDVVPRRADDILARAHRALDLPVLIARGWDPDQLMFRPSPDDENFGFDLCERLNCDRGGRKSRFKGSGLCDSCYYGYINHHAERMTVDEYKLTRRRKTRRARPEERPLCLVCRVPGHERKQRKNGLCMQCDGMRKDRGQSVEELIAGDERYPPAEPRPSLGHCELSGCPDNIEATVQRLCRACSTTFERRKDRSMTLDDFKRLGTYSVLNTGREVDLSTLAELPRAQVLLGFQRIIALGIQAPPGELEVMVRRFGLVGSGDLRRTVPDQIAGRKCRMRLASVVKDASELAATTIEEEFRRDIWREAVICPGRVATRNSRITFEPISQPWLRETAKRFAMHRLGQAKYITVQADVRNLGICSKFLAAAARGETPSDLDRELLDRLVIWCHAERRGEARPILRAPRDLFRFARRRGMTRPGGPCWGLKDEVLLLDEDLKKRTDGTEQDDEPGKALPEYVLAQLLEPEALAQLQPTYAAVWELLAHIGRRPIEILTSPADCLIWLEQPGPGGVARRPALRYKRHKKPAKWLILPIHESTAALIQRQQRTVLEQHPGHKLSELKLFPRTSQNPRGRSPITSQTFSTQIGKWVAGLDSIVDVDGEPFNRDLIYPYTLRHSYAQRHADHNTPLDVLQQLMDHRSPSTTQIYYRVRDERLFEAVSRVGPMTVDATGSLVGAGEYPDAEQLTRSVGQIPVPLGYCVEPHNVKALGASCPFSHQCLGCEYYRTDPSYLPDLYAYLERLLDARERLRSTVPQLAEWARIKAMPNDAEITAVRNLIRSNEDIRAELSDEERRKLEELFRVLRAGRHKLDDTLPITMVASARQPSPTFSPPNFTPVLPAKAVRDA